MTAGNQRTHEALMLRHRCHFTVDLSPSEVEAGVDLILRSPPDASKAVI
jgi:hypothetical protein